MPGAQQPVLWLESFRSSGCCGRLGLRQLFFLFCYFAGSLFAGSRGTRDGCWPAKRHTDEVRGHADEVKGHRGVGRRYAREPRPADAAAEGRERGDEGEEGQGRAGGQRL
eukprot:3243169-Rhodomonas_salina.3